MRSSALCGVRGSCGWLGWLGLAIVAACSGGDNTGLVLAIRAPEVPAEARRIEVVLASADAADIEMVAGQRGGGIVRYYRQKSTAGVIALRPDDPRLDGFEVRIEGREGKGDEPFVPLVFAYAGAGEELAEGEQPIAAGAVLDGAGLPVALEVPAGSRLEATVDMIPLQPADPDLGVMSGQILEVACPEGGPGARSGVAWQPGRLQLRLLRPAPFGEATLDATMRRLDLDCDGFAAGGDCDDVLPQYHPRAAEACDGDDRNCDGSLLAIAPCTLTQAACPGNFEGVQLCHDMDPPRKSSECVPTPECECNLGTCSRCTFAYVAEDELAKPCAPGITELPFLGAGTCSAIAPCTVEVLQVDGPWRATVAAEPKGSFGLRAVVTKNSVALRLKPDESSLMPERSIGALHLAISGSTPEPLYLRVDLGLEPAGRMSCDEVKLPDGDYPITCN